MSTTTSTTTTSTTAPEERKETTTTGKTKTTTTTTTTGTTGTAAGTGTGTGTGTAAGTEQGREKHQYPYKKLGDLLDEVDDLLTHRREELQQKATEKVHDLLKQLNQLYIEIKGMVSKEPVDPAALADKQERLNQLENQAVQGVYGAEAKICPLDQEGQPIHHVRIEAIPPGQATVRHLIEKCHQMITRVLDRLDEMANKLVEAPAGTTSATSTTSVKIGGQEQAKISAQKEPTEVTVTKGTSESGTRGAGISAH